jgi:hypothetical protein
LPSAHGWKCSGRRRRSRKALDAFGGFIQVGAQILREYQRRFRDTETALQVYAGAFDEPSAQYANKVFAERARLEVLRQKARKQPQSA